MINIIVFIFFLSRVSYFDHHDHIVIRTLLINRVKVTILYLNCVIDDHVGAFVCSFEKCLKFLSVKRDDLYLSVYVSKLIQIATIISLISFMSCVFFCM